MPETETIQPERSRGDAAQAASLFVVLDAAKPVSGTRHLLRGVDRVVIGRGAVRAAKRTAGTLHIELADPRVSIEHAVFERVVLNEWVVRDLGSKNGVAVAGASITRRLLADGDWITIGRTVLRFRVLEVARDASDDIAGDAAR